MAARLKDYPVSEFLEGTRSAWSIVLGPLVAGAFGVLLGAFAVGFWDIEVTGYWLYAGALIFPVLVILDLTAFSWMCAFFAAAIVVTTLRFWFAERRRLEWLFLLCLAVFGNVVYLLAQIKWCVVNWALFAVAVLALGLLYSLLRLPRILWWWRNRHEDGVA